MRSLISGSTNETENSTKGKTRHSRTTQHAKSTKSRPTIGLLIGRLGDIGYAANVWPGVADVAQERDVNLICFVGGALRATHEFDAQRNVAYDLASATSVDGLVAMSGSIGQFIGPEQLRIFYERYHPLPMVSVAMALEGIPSVLVDNRKGIRDAIAHLIEVHGLRRIAFIRGPETNPEAEQRYQAYVEVLAEHGISLDPNLVVPGNYLSRAGMEAIRTLLESRHTTFEAVASANDEMALGAMIALRERGIGVPNDVSIVGFDDLEEARLASPPLTTVRQPLYQQGRRATEILLARLAGEDVPEQVALPTELIVRQSCGCFPRPVLTAALESKPQIGGTLEAPMKTRRTHIIYELTKAAGASATSLDSKWAERLLDAYIATIKGRQRNAFLPTLDEILRRVGIEGGYVMQWHQVISILRQLAPLHIRSEETLSRTEIIWQQAQSLIGDIAQWAQAYRRTQSERNAFEFTTRISEPLMTAFDLAGLTDVVAHQLPQMGIRSCYISLYEHADNRKPETPPEWSRLILAYNENGRIEIELGGQRFISRHLVPEGVISREQRFAIMLEPLHFRDETQLGFILFEPLHTEVGALREALSRQISTALKGALLLQERQRTEEALRASEQVERHFQERLRTLLEVSNDLSRADTVDELCRRAVELGREQLGFDRLGIWFRGSDPGSVVGSYGTNGSGNLSDERALHLGAGSRQAEILKQTRPITLRQEGVELYDGVRTVIGHGDQAVAAMWDGEQTIGLIATDNLLLAQPITEHDCELLNLYASTLGYLCSRKRAEEALKQYSGRLEGMVDERTRELRQAQEQLVRQEKLAVLGQLAGGLGHELRNPLGVISNAVYYLLMTLPDIDETTNEYLGILSSEVRNAEKIISDLLDFSRVRMAEKSTVTIAELIDQVLKKRPAPASVEVTVQIDRDLPAVFVDPRQIEQVLTNLITNALQAMTTPDPILQPQALATPRLPDIARLTICAQAKQDKLAISISDTGCGIPPENLNKIFEPLFTTKPRGIGLGLAICKSLAEANGGSLEVKSEAGKGSTFSVYLPVQEGTIL